MVGCLSENTIQELVAGALLGEVLAQAHRHIESCGACRALVVELARDADLASLIRGDTAPAMPRGAAPRSPVVVDADPAAVAGRFQILRPLGRGGMGVVYEALDRRREARVALKTLQRMSADGLLRFKTEFRALQDLHHPNLVRFGDLIEEAGRWWLTMELVEGTSLLEHVRPGGQLDEGRLRAALAQLAGALRALHAQKLVHRDVKPHNVLVTPAGRVVLLDFGLVAEVAQSESNVVGTPAYMAPEQATNHEVGPAADWYAVGALLYEALTGALPFQGAPLQVLVAKQQDAPRPPGELAPVPADLEALCLQLLAVEPAARLAAAAALTRLGLGAGGVAAVPAAAAPPRPFVGRRHELALLVDAFAATRAGADAIVLVQGESGIGKSALVEQLVEDLRGAEPALLVLAGRCYEREAVPYKGVDGVVDALARHLRRLSEPEAAAILPRRAGLLVQAFPVLGKVAALSRLPADTVLDPVELRTRAFTALRELLGRLAERRPVVVWIDDLQWADADSLELLAWVMARPEAPPLLLVLTSRPPREVTDAGADADASAAAGALARVRSLPGLRQLDLAPLPREEAEALAGQLLAAAAAPASTATAATIAAEAAGHPLFIDALVRYAALRSPAAPPPRLSDALWGRIAELDPEARRLLALVAVAGRPLAPELLAAAAAVPVGALDPVLGTLRHAHLVRIVASAGPVARPGPIAAYHDRIREAVVEHLEPAQRQECHRALARALLTAAAPPAGAAPGTAASEIAPAPRSPGSEPDGWGPEAVGVHLHAIGELGQAARYLARAAAEAAAALAFDRAARLYRQALALHEQCDAAQAPLGDTREVLGHLARALASAGRGAEAAAAYFTLAQKAWDVREEALEARLRGAEQLLRSGHRQEGRAALAEVLAELDLRPASTRAGALLRLLWRRAWVRLRGFKPRGPRARGGRASRDATTPRARLRLEACRVAWLTTDVPAEYLTRYQVMALRAADPRNLGQALNAELLIALLGGGAGAPRTARLLEHLGAVARQSADPYMLGYAENVRATLALLLGRWERGREHGARAMQLFRDRCLGASYETAISAVSYLLCSFYLGELRALVREVSLLKREAEERQDHFTLTTLSSGVISLMSLVQGRSELARQQVERGMSLWSSGEPDVRSLAGQLSQGEIDLYEGDGAGAYRRIDQDWRRRMALPFTRMGFVRARALSLHGVAALAACRAGGPARRLVRAAARDARALRAMGQPWTAALARILDAGAALVIRPLAEARAQLELAHAELDAAGMVLHAALARRRLGELAGGAEGAAAIAEVDAWLAAQDVQSPERFARVYLPEVA